MLAPKEIDPEGLNLFELNLSATKLNPSPQPLYSRAEGDGPNEARTDGRLVRSTEV